VIYQFLVIEVIHVSVLLPQKCKGGSLALKETIGYVTTCGNTNHFISAGRNTTVGA